MLQCVAVVVCTYVKKYDVHRSINMYVCILTSKMYICKQVTYRSSPTRAHRSIQMYVFMIINKICICNLITYRSSPTRAELVWPRAGRCVYVCGKRGGQGV